MATVPDFGALANQQQAANDDATRRTTWSSRPDQTGAMGSISWNQQPDGRWVNSSTMNGQAQGLFDQTMQGQMGLAGQVGGGLNYGNLPAMPTVGGYNQQVIDSWNALQAPELAKNEAAQRQRLAAQGITNGSNISNISDRNLGNVRTDANNKAILAGYTQGNTEFTQGLQARQQGASEAEKSYGAAISGMGALGTARGDLNPNKWVSDVPQGAAYTPNTVYGAAQDQFNANMMNENAATARSQGNTSAAIDALRAAGGLSGLGSMANTAWNWGKDLYSGWSGSGGGSDDIGALIALNGWGG